MVDLNTRTPSTKEFSHDYFRPNIVIDGPEIKAYDEDNWDWIKIGDVVFRVTIPCTRCLSTTVDPEEGFLNIRREPLKTLEK